MKITQQQKNNARTMKYGMHQWLVFLEHDIESGLFYYQGKSSGKIYKTQNELINGANDNIIEVINE